MARLLFSGLCLIVVLACAEQTETTLPSDEELVRLIRDLHLAEASMARVHISMQDSVSMQLRARIARDHGITPDEMDGWLETLQKSPEHLLVVYDSVIATLERDVSKTRE